MSIKQKALNLSIQIMRKTIQVVGRGKSTAILAQISEDIAPILTEKTDFGLISFFLSWKNPRMACKNIINKRARNY